MISYFNLNATTMVILILKSKARILNEFSLLSSNSGSKDFFVEICEIILRKDSNNSP